MQLGFQLYSARNYPLEQVLGTIAALGYKQVEGFGGVMADPAALRRQLDAHDLTMPTAHISLADLEDTRKTLETAAILGIQVVICPWLAPEQRPKEAIDWKLFGKRLEAIAKPYRDIGLGFAYHNHDFEFARFGSDYGMDLLLQAAPSVDVEADVAWIVRGNADPAPWLERHGQRIVAVHLKDLAPAGTTVEDGWADFGTGTMPWRDLLRIIRDKTAARFFVVEHDNPSDIDRFASRAMASFKTLGA